MKTSFVDLIYKLKITVRLLGFNPSDFTIKILCKHDDYVKINHLLKDYQYHNPQVDSIDLNDFKFMGVRFKIDTERTVL